MPETSATVRSVRAVDDKAPGEVVARGFPVFDGGRVVTRRVYLIFSTTGSRLPSHVIVSYALISISNTTGA